MGRYSLASHVAGLSDLRHAFHQRFRRHDKQLGHLLLERHGADALVHSSTRGGCGVFGILTVTSAFAARTVHLDPSPAQPLNARLPPVKAASQTKRRRVMESTRAVTLLPFEQRNPLERRSPFEPIAHALAISLTPTSIAPETPCGNGLPHDAEARNGHFTFCEDGGTPLANRE